MIGTPDLVPTLGAWAAPGNAYGDFAHPRLRIGFWRGLLWRGQDAQRLGTHSHVKRGNEIDFERGNESEGFSCWPGHGAAVGHPS